MITAVSIPSTIAVYGNGKCIGVYSGSTTAGLASITRGGDMKAVVGTYTSTYNAAVGTTVSGSTNTVNLNGFGLSTDTSGKSGMVAKSDSITRTSISFKFCIKY